MLELTDLEICQKVAKIEGFNQVEIRGDVFVSLGFSCDKRYNPLTDDALCFQLMVKYDMPLMKYGAADLYECIFDIDRALSGSGIIYNESPNRAICLAIIEANKE